MPPRPIAVPRSVAGLYSKYVAWVRVRAGVDDTFCSGAQRFLARFPELHPWADQPLDVRLQAGSELWSFLDFLMLHGHLRPGYDYLLERRFYTILREGKRSPLGPEIDRFFEAAARLGYSLSATRSAARIAVRMLIQEGVRDLCQLTPADFGSFERAIAEREARLGRALEHYRSSLYATRAVIYHVGAPTEPAPKRTTLRRWSLERHLDGVHPQVLRPMVAYLELMQGTRPRSSVQNAASELAHFGRFLARNDPHLESLADLDRRRHIEPYLAAVGAATSRRTGAPIAASTAKTRILTVGRFLDAMNEWGWADAPRRRLVFTRDTPRLPHPLPRYLPPDADRRLTRALEASPHRLRADALLLLRATGLRIGELCDLELDCVHEVPGQGAWLKVPLGKLATERMVPIDDDTVALVDRIATQRSPGRPLRHPRSGHLVEFLLTYQGRRVSADSLREELHRASAEAGLPPTVPHQLRHTYATALVNAGCSLQALMALLGHVSAAMSLRYGRLFDATVREDYERSLAQAKARLGPVLPGPAPLRLETDWRAAPLIKARMAGGYCVRSLAQGACPYTNICEHCPNYRSGPSFLPVLATQRADTAALLADAETRGWGEEAARHRRLLERLDVLIAKAQAG